MRLTREDLDEIAISGGLFVPTAEVTSELIRLARLGLWTSTHMETIRDHLSESGYNATQALIALDALKELPDAAR